LPFHTIDIIFNHKNIWANLQNPNPANIYYHIHDNTKWLPLITDPYDKHPLIIESEKDDNGADEVNEKKDDVPKKKDKAGEDTKMLTMKDTGDYMKPFLPFFDAKSLEPPLTVKMVEKIEAKIFKEVEIALKQVRSSRNLNCNIKNNVMTRSIMRQYLDYLEDMECLRVSKPNTAKANVNKEIMKLVPENYKISMLPTFFNNIDSERIGTVIRDTTSEFLIDTPKKVMFSIAVKVYAYPHGVCSVRVVLLKLHQFEGAMANDDEGVAEGTGSK